VLGGLSLLPAFGIQRDLLRAKGAMEAGRDAFFAGDLPGARHHFDDAASAFIQARSKVGGPLMRLAGNLPILGRTPDAIEAMASAGTNVAAAGSQLAQAVALLPGGLAALAPKNHFFSLDALSRLQPVLSTVSGLVQQGSEVLAGAERAWVLAPVADALRQFEAPLEELDRALGSAAVISAQLPEFLGTRGLRQYFVAAQNPAELRGTGGFIGSYALLQAYRGGVRFTRFQPIETLPDAVGQITPPNPDYAERYEDFGGAGFWRNINVTPDFPSAAVAIERLYREVRGVKLDGVIAASPQSLAALLSATGPVKVPSLGATLSSENVVDYTTHTAYSRITNAELRKRVLGDAARATFDRFIVGARNPIGGIRALAEAVAEGHLLFHAVNEDVQRAFDLARISGRLERTGGDFVSVSATNAAANKLDFYVGRSLDYDVRLNADGSANSTLTVRLDNPAPSSGQPQYVIGPYRGVSEAGESVSFLSAYCTEACELERHTIDGGPAPVGVERELGHRVFSEFVHVDSGDATELGYELSVPDAWIGDALSGAYRLTIQDQPSTLQPTTVTVTVHSPPGTDISDTSLPMEVRGDRATWTGRVGKLLTLEVEFQRPLLNRAWSRFVRFLVKPLF
jgi:uncharacterized protein DUF4012